jgi:glycosyltransferase involved in cell wall biosynthesis
MDVMNGAVVLRFTRRMERDRFSKFGVHHNAGNNRKRQVQELLNEAGIEVKDYPIEGMFSRLERLQALRYLYSNPHWRPKINLRHLSYLAGYFCSHVRALSAEGQRGVVISEEPHDFVWYHAVQRAGWRSIVLPHCIESLWPDWSNWITGTTIPRSVDEELRYLGTANAVFFISREEQWLAANYGVTGYYLPYFPPSDVREQLRGDRLAKLQALSKGREFLIFGSAVQPNTIEGMKQQTRLLVDIMGDRRDTTVHIVGVGTEKMRDIWDHRLFQFHGPVSDEVLRQIKSRVRACLLSGPRGNGALTRIPEMLMSGVPVIADNISCRSAWTYEGLHCFDSPEEFAQLLEADLAIPPEPPKPVSRETDFVHTVRRLLNS